MGRGKRTGAASDQDQGRQRPHPGFRFSGLSLPGRLARAADEEPTETPGRGPAENQTHERAMPALHLCSAEFATSRMVHVFPTLSRVCVPPTGRLDSRPLAQHLAEASRPARPGPRVGPQTLAQQLLRSAWAVLPGRRPCRFRSILTQVNHQLESRMREIRLSGSEGGGPQTNAASLPLLRARPVGPQTANPRICYLWDCSENITRLTTT